MRKEEVREELTEKTVCASDLVDGMLQEKWHFDDKEM
jgi:hypothetical protein